MLCLSGFELYSRWVPLIIDFWRRFNAIPRRHGILWWYHVNKYRAMRGNRSELAPGRKSLRCHVNTSLFRTVDWSHLAASHAYIIYSLISSGHGQLLYVELFMLDEPNARTIDFVH